MKSIIEACIGVLGIDDVCHFTSKDMGYYPFYFQGNGILCSLLVYFQGYWIFRKINYEDICLFTTKDMGYW